MIVAGVVIETVPGAAPRVAARLLRVEGLELQGGDGDHRLAAVFTGDDGRALEELADLLVRSDPEVLAVLPTYVARNGQDEDETGEAALAALAPNGLRREE
jgi:hypothetical protein